MRRKKKSRSAKRAQAHSQRKPAGPAAARAAPPLSRREVLAAGALCLLAAACFFPVTSAGFIWDDTSFTDVWPVQTWHGLRTIWFDPNILKYEGHYWPLLYTLFWVEHKLWGLAPLGYHLVNLLLHISVMLLLWRLLERLAVPGAWLAAALFAVHPLHVEPVVWVIGRKDVLAALFFLLCVWSYLRFIELGRHADYARTLVLFVAGLLCKSTVITLPAALLILHWWQRGRITWNDMRRIMPLAVIGLAITSADWSYYSSREVLDLGYSLTERVLIAARAVWFYAGKMVWPGQLPVVYPHWETGIGEVRGWACLAAAIAVVAALWRLRARIGRGPLAAVAFFIVTLSPTLGFVDYGYMQFSFVADRYHYLPGMGLFAAAAAGAARAAALLRARMMRAAADPADAQRVMRARAIALNALGAALLAPLLAAFGAVTWQQTGIYRDNLTFYTHMISLNPSARNAHYNLGREHHLAGRYEKALVAYRIARAQRPDYVWVYLGLGSSSEALGHDEDAEINYKHALRLSPHSTDALNHLGAFRLKQQRYQEALDLFRKIIKYDPGFAKVYSGIGVALSGLNRHAEALRNFDRALALDPTQAEARTNRAYAVEALQKQKAQSQ
ncbi:MAG: tetratricopeptide repeat protein [Gammaproteobacteria bacterium]